MTVKIKGELEIDEERGVIYFHSSDTGHTALRICSLPTPVPDPSSYGSNLDITHRYGCSWTGESKSPFPKMQDDIFSKFSTEEFSLRAKMVIDVSDDLGRCIASVFPDDKYVQFHDQFTQIGCTTSLWKLITEDGFDCNHT